MPGGPSDFRTTRLPPATTLDAALGSGAAAVHPKGTVVLLISGAVDRQWAADAAIELGSAWAKGGRRIVLADLHLEAPLLHSGLGIPNLEGIVDIFLYGASLSRIAQPVRDGAFYLIPAGTYAPDAEEIYRHPRWRKLVAGFRDTDAALLLFVPADNADLAALAKWSSEAVLLGPPPGADLIEDIRAAGLELIAIVEPARDEAVSPTGEPRAESAEAATPQDESTAEMPLERTAPAPTEPVSTPPDGALRSRTVPASERPIEADLELPPPPVRRRPERRRASLVLWILFAIILLGTAGYLLAVLRPDLVPGAPVRAPASDAVSGAATLDSDASRLGELLPYSVQVRAFTSLGAAVTELSEDQRRLSSSLFFISPEEIQGILYYKILAGLAADTATAKSLRDRLVEIGSVDAEDAAGTWSLLQFTPLAFDLGEFPTPQEAGARADSLLAREIPAYVATVPYADGTERWQIYGGAYRDSASASIMREMLQAADLPTRLTARTGLPVTLGP